MESGLFTCQLPLWIGQKLHQDSPLYNMAFAFLLSGRIDDAAFHAAWSRVVAANDVLRTTFGERSGGATREILLLPGPGTQTLDFSGEADPAGAFHEWAQARCTRPLPLSGPLVESVLARLGEHRYGWYLNQHHLVTDAWATVLLFRQVAAEYAALTAGTARPPAPTPYDDAAASAAAFADAAARAVAERHWQARARSTAREARFYGDGVRPSTTRSERRTIVLDLDTTKRLKEIAGEPGFVSLTPDISLFAVFAALLSAWLHRVTGQEEVGFDAPAHNRPTAAAKRALGLFIEMFPFVVRIDPGDSLRALGRACLLEAQQFLRYALPGTAPASAGAAANVVLNFFPASFGTFAGLPVSSTWLHPGASDSVHALRLQVHDYDGSGRITLHLDLNEEIFPPAQRARALTHFERLVAAALAQPDQPLASFDILADDERETLLVGYNRDSGVPLPAHTVVARVHDQAARTPDRIALRQGARTMTFRELQDQVTRAARGLRSAGVTRGTTVAVAMPRTIETVVACLAILQARGAWVPLDPAAPAGRLASLLEDCGAELVLTGDPAHAVTATARRAMTLDMLLSTQGDDTPPDAPALDDLAYVMYTSGSTGAPKGVLVEHAGLADYIDWAERQYVRGSVLTFPLFTPLTFDLTITSLFLPLVTGGTLAIYPEGGGPADTALAAVASDNLADIIKLTPSHLSLLRHMDLSHSRIRRIIVGGEDFRAHLARAMVDRLGASVEIYNEYGPTEAVVGCMLHRYDPARDTAPSVPIGVPADHVGLYVLTERMAPVPEGAPGELYISRRAGHARGYHRQPELTARAFVANPFVPGDRLYRSGDLVRFGRPGMLEYLGRTDRQLKVSGIRVEPGEIEAVFLGHPEIQACAVTAEPREESPAVLAAAVSHCERCGLPSDYPDARIDNEGVCSICRSYEAVRDRARTYFETPSDLEAIFEASRTHAPGPYDALMLLSGGKDSTYALCRLVDMGQRVYAFSFDNGYISEGAKANLRRVTEALDVPLEIATTPAMPAIFRDSLARFSNVCNGCFKTIYTLATQRALELGIPVIVTGLSRGQLFETRLSAGIFSGDRSAEEVDAAVLEARKAYHRQDDEVSRQLDVRGVRDDRTFEQIRFVDFYRYCDVGLSEMLAYLQQRVPWMRPADTGRSTNCLINDVGIYVHRQERGHHNYALPYSWDVRLGQKTRAQALGELDDEIDVARVRRILAEIGYEKGASPDGTAQTVLTAWYVAAREIPDGELRRHAAGALPSALVPQAFGRLDALPLTPNGKVDEAALRASRAARTDDHVDTTPPDGALEERIAAIWRDVLKRRQLGILASFFELGGTSLAAMEVALRICREFEVDLPLQAVFTHSTVKRLAAHVEELIVEAVNALTDEEAARLVERAEARHD